MKKIIIEAVGALAIICLIIGGAVTIVLNFTPLYAMDIDRFDLVRISGLSKAQLMENYRALISYNNIIGTSCLNLPDFPMSETGRIHFYEVKLIFTGLQWAALGGAAVLAGMACFFRSATKAPAPARGIMAGATVSVAREPAGATVSVAREPAGATASLTRGIMAGAGITLTLPLILALACGVNWNGTFLLFHKVFFNNDYWIFDAAMDPVITVLPDGFFLHCAIAIFVLVAATSAFILAACYAILKREKAAKRA